MDAAVGGDLRAFGALYAHLAPLLRSWAYAELPMQRTRIIFEPEDLVQATFLQAFTAIGRYRRGDKGFAAWLFRIARNLMIDAWRHETRSRLVFRSLDDGPWSMTDGDEQLSYEDCMHDEDRLVDPERVVEAQELAALFARVLDGDYGSIIREREVYAAVRHHAHGVTHAQIQQEMGGHPSYVRTSAWRGVRRLRKRVEAEGYVA